MHDTLYQCPCGYKIRNEDVFILHTNDCQVAKDSVKK